MTAGLAIKRSALLEEAERCCHSLGNHTVVEKNDCTNWSNFLDWLQQMQPQVLLIDVEHFQNIVEERVRQVKAASPQSMIIALHDVADSQMIISAMRAGIDEYFYPPLENNLRQVLERKIDQHVRDQFLTNSDRKTIGFLSAKGGCGGTTLACHAALELGKRMHQTGTYHVLLADLDVTGGNIRFVMRSKSSYSIVDAMRTGQGLDVGTWNQMVSGGYQGLEVLSGPVNMCVERMPEQREVERVLNFARARYQWTVLDLGCSLTPYTMSILESINELYLVASPDVLALYQMKQIMSELVPN
jgi:pilus assembly protein CpaE